MDIWTKWMRRWSGVERLNSFSDKCHWQRMLRQSALDLAGFVQQEQNRSGCFICLCGMFVLYFGHEACFYSSSICQYLGQHPPQRSTGEIGRHLEEVHADLSDDDILARLLELNLKRAGQSATW